MDNQFNPKDLMRAIKRRFKPAVILTLILLVASVAFALLAPATYRSYSTILIEQQEIPQDLVRTTVTSFADQRIQMISQRVMTFSKLSEIIKKYDLYADELEKEPLEVVIEEMKQDINHRMISAEVVDPRSGRPVEATIAFSLAYRSESPKMAQAVANELTSLFLSENIRNRREMAEEAESFLVEEVKRLESRSRELEQKLAQFKEKNLRKLPELTTLNFNLLDRTEREYFDLGKEIQSLEERKLILESQLTQIDPSEGLVGDNRHSVLTPTARAKVLQNQYINLLATYSESHPDVVKAKRELDRLVGDGDYPLEETFINKQVTLFEAELSRLRIKYGERHPDVARVEKTLSEFRLRAGIAALKSDLSESNSGIESLKSVDNPTYVQLATSLETINNELVNLRQTRREVKIKAEDLERSIAEAPKVEQEYRELTRDYQNTAAKYQELKAKQLEATLARTLEQERKGERFTLIEPPIVPVEPVSPNRPLWIAMGIIFSLGMGAALIFLLEKMDLTLHSRDAVRKFTGLQPLATIPHIVTVVEETKRKRLQLVSAMACVLLIVSCTAVVHLAFMPLDVLWYVALRKFG